ncbi:MAG: ribosomal protein L13e [Promethearchaeota archaeon]
MEEKIIPIVKSPSKKAHLRRGKGFSLKEIKIAGKNVKLLRDLKIPIDFFRKSVHNENIDKLKKIKAIKKPIKKKKPYVSKERIAKKETFKGYYKKRILVKEKVIPKEEPIKKEPTVKKPRTKKPSVKAKQVKKLKEPSEDKGIPLTKLPGLGPATAKKFEELGVNNVEQLCQENPKELAMLIKGCSEERIKNWIVEGKNLLNK